MFCNIVVSVNGVTSQKAFSFIKFPLGTPLLSVSILMFKLLFGSPNFHNDNIIWSKVSQFKISFVAIFWTLLVNQIASFFITSVIVGVFCMYRQSHFSISSHAKRFPTHIHIFFAVIFLFCRIFSLSLIISSSSALRFVFSVSSCIFTPHISPPTVPSLRSTILVTAQPLVVTFAILVFLSPHALVLATKSPSSSIST